MTTKQQKFKLITGDVMEQLALMPANFFDAAAGDPPYGIGFMGKTWDSGVPSAAVYAELLRVLKPGAFVIQFGGTRTWHRLACNIEDGGFQMRDSIMWLYGSGFPKSHNISKAIDKAAGVEREVVGERRQRGMLKADAAFQKNTSSSPVEVLTAPATPAATQWDGYGTALKPAWEPALLFQKPLAGTFAGNALAWGCGGLNIDGSRVGSDTRINSYGGVSASNPLAGTSFGGTTGGFNLANKGPTPVTGRFPANLILDEASGQALDDTQPVSKSVRALFSAAAPTGNGITHGYMKGEESVRGHNDSGGPSRFFYCAKVGTKERNGGCDDFELSRPDERDEVAAGHFHEKGVQPAKNNHPTLKPLALTEYLARLLLVPPRTDGQPRRILVPFSGAGSEVIGCLKAGWDEVWGIELSPEYVAIATARIAHHTTATAMP